MRQFEQKLRARKSLIRLFLLGSACLMISAVLMEYGADILGCLGIFTPGVSYAIGMATIGNLGATSDRDSSGAQICMRIWLVHRQQLDPNVAFPLPDADGCVGTISLLTGEVMHYFEAINDSMEDKSSGTKGDVTTEVKNSFSFIVGGNKKKAIQFMEEFAGEGFIIIYQMADDRKFYILGTELKPMFLQAFERTNNKSQRSVQFTFENTSFLQVKEYTGSIIKAPDVILAANASSIAFTAADNYKTGPNTAATVISAFSGLSKGDVGRVITITGGGGAFPSTIESSTNILLKDDESWNATSGSRITLKVFDTTTLVEISRVQRA